MSDFQIEKPDTAGIAARAKGILTRPAAEWPMVAAETTPPAKVLMGYAIPLALIGPIATIIGQSVFGMPTLLGTVRLGIGAIVATAVLGFVMSLVSLFVVSFVANALSTRFGGRNDFPAAFRLVAYSMTAAWLAGIFGIVPALAIVGTLLSLYSFYLFYKGATPVLGVPTDKAGFYTVVTVVAAIIVQFILSILLGLLAAPFVMGSAAVSSAALSDIQLEQ